MYQNDGSDNDKLFFKMPKKSEKPYNPIKTESGFEF